MDLDEKNYSLSLIRNIAAELNLLSMVRSTRFRYDQASEGIAWDDEVPVDIRVRALAVWGLRPIWRFRTSVILGQPDVRWQEQWDLARGLFPAWVGFSPDRLDPSPEVRQFIQDKSAEFAARVARATSQLDKKSSLRKQGDP